MKQGTMNILFFVLKTKLLKNGEAPVLMRITINGSYDDARIQRSVPLNLWNAAKGCSKGRDRASRVFDTKALPPVPIINPSALIPIR